MRRKDEKHDCMGGVKLRNSDISTTGILRSASHTYIYSNRHANINTNAQTNVYTYTNADTGT